MLRSEQVEAINILRSTIRPLVSQMPRAPFEGDAAGLHGLGYNYADGQQIATIMGLKATRLAALGDTEYIYHGVRAVMAGGTTNGNKIIAGLPSTVGLVVGMAITGTGVGAGSVIATIDSSVQVTGTVNSTATATVTITFAI